MSWNQGALRSARGWGLLVPLMMIGACGGGSSQQAKEPGAKASSAGAKCLKDAAIERAAAGNAPDKIGLSQILVRTTEQGSPQQGNAVATASAGRPRERTREAACLRALEALKKLEGGADWADVVRTYSDAPGATEGALGRVARDELEPAFAAAAFSLEVNQLSYVVESTRGFHVILRTE